DGLHGRAVDAGHVAGAYPEREVAPVGCPVEVVQRQVVVDLNECRVLRRVLGGAGPGAGPPGVWFWRGVGPGVGPLFAEHQGGRWRGWAGPGTRQAARWPSL